MPTCSTMPPNIPLNHYMSNILTISEIRKKMSLSLPQDIDFVFYFAWNTLSRHFYNWYNLII